MVYRIIKQYTKIFNVHEMYVYLYSISEQLLY